jgi:putative ABC transport system permease protein
METLWQDLKYGIRALARTPGFAAIAILTLALGIGANTAIFSVVNGVLIRPLPFQNAGRLVWGWGSFHLGNQAAVSPSDFLDYRAQQNGFEHFAAVGAMNQLFNLAGAEKSEQVKVSMVTTGFFEALGVQPLFGRTFAAADEQVSDPQVVILGHDLWLKRFGGNPGIVGQSVMIDGVGRTVIGVLPTDLRLLSPADLWIATPFQNQGMSSRRSHFLRIVGVLKAGVKLSQAQAQMDTIAARLAEQYPDTNAGWNVRLEPLQAVLVGDLQPALLMILGAVALVLLIACSNVASLLLARNTARSREIAIRTALGAGRARLVRQLLTESCLLALAGGGAGVFLASTMVDALRKLGPDYLPRLDEVNVSGMVLACTAVLSILTGILFGLGPALQASRQDLTKNLKEGGAAGGSRSKHRAHNVLVVTEVALSLVVLIASGLLLNSFWRLIHVSPGFDPSRVVTAQISLVLEKYKEASKRANFFDELTTRTEALPGVDSTGFISELPLTGQADDTWVTTREAAPSDLKEWEDADLRFIAGDYFRTMRIPLLAGRGFSRQDTGDSTRVVIINEPFARRYFAGQNPIGKRLKIFEGKPEFVTREVVGIVGGNKHFALEETLRPEMFVPYSQGGFFNMNMVARSSGDPAMLPAAVREAVRAIDPDETTSPFRTMDDLVSSSTAGSRLNTFLLGSFGVLSLLLTAAGIFGVLSYLVTQRTREIGVRMALGAQPRDVLRVIVGHGMRLTLIGLGLGVAGALQVTRWMTSFLYGVKPTDPWTFAGVALLLAATAFAACYVPARRAMRVDPMVALRYE